MELANLHESTLGVNKYQQRLIVRQNSFPLEDYTTHRNYLALDFVFSQLLSTVLVVGICGSEVSPGGGKSVLQVSSTPVAGGCEQCRVAV